MYVQRGGDTLHCLDAIALFYVTQFSIIALYVFDKTLGHIYVALQ